MVLQADRAEPQTLLPASPAAGFSLGHSHRLCTSRSLRLELAQSHVQAASALGFLELPTHGLSN